MERRHFELDRGYLNIDDEALYFTRSGNWQEAKGTKELTARSRPRKTLHQLFGVALIVIVGAFNLMRSDGHRAENLLLSLSTAGLGMLVLYRSLRHDLATAYRIPFSKLRGVETDERNVTILFVDGDWKERAMTVKLPPAALDALANWPKREGSVGG